MHPMLNIAVRAARKAGNLIAKNYETPDAVEASQKGSNDFVTNVDRDAERLIVEVIRKSYPQHSIITEESGELAGDDQDIQWVIDPLDGTTNFIKRLPHFSVSIAVRIKGRTEVAVVYDPMRNELFTAVRGQGAQLNGYRLRGSTARDLDGTILATGFPFAEAARYPLHQHRRQTVYPVCRFPSHRFCCAGSGLRGRWPSGRFLRDRPEAMGFRRRRTAGARSGRPGDRFHRQPRLHDVR